MSLEWPEGFERTAPEQRRRYPGGFEVSRKQAFDSIVEELEKIDAVNVRVETAAPHTAKHPHRPYADRDPDDPGVVAYWEKDGQGFAAPCDRWNNLRDNARAIALYLDAKRAIERYGVQTIGSEYATQALPEGNENREKVVGRPPPHEVLGIAPDADPAVVRGAFRELAKKHHADTGDDPDSERLQEIKRAREAMLDDT